jgi:hypothetical protein
LSTTNGWPSSFDSASAAMRPTMSVEPPGGNGMIRVMGFCAWMAFEIINNTIRRKIRIRAF